MHDPGGDLARHPLFELPVSGANFDDGSTCSGGELLEEVPENATTQRKEGTSREPDDSKLANDGQLSSRGKRSLLPPLERLATARRRSGKHADDAPSARRVPPFLEGGTAPHRRESDQEPYRANVTAT